MEKYSKNFRFFFGDSKKGATHSVWILVNLGFGPIKISYYISFNFNYIKS